MKPLKFLSQSLFPLILSFILLGCTPAAAGSARDPSPAGGKVVISLASEPANLDASSATSLYDALILGRVGAWLLQRAPNGEIVPYLAERWEVSDDGRTYTFTLRTGVKFHNGDTLTAQDYAWTFERALDMNLSAAYALGNVDKARAIDEYTLEIQLKEPYAPFLTMMVSFGPYLQPLSQRAILEAGEGYARHPVGVGPFRFLEWVPGESVLLERNPDFVWGPQFAHQGPPYIELLEYRILPEDAVRLAALETGEVDIGYDIQPRDIALLEKSGKFNFLAIPFTGIDPFIAINRNIPALQDLRVRQALIFGIDRDALVRIVLGGRGHPQFGPVSPPVIGYWPGVETIGPRFDPQRARSLLEEAGYTPGPSGVFEKDGQALEFTLLASNTKNYDILAAALADMLGRIGVKIRIEVVESGILRQRVRFDGDYELGIAHAGSPDIDILSTMFSSGALFSGLALGDPVLDDLLRKTQTTLNSGERMAYAAQVQKRILDQAYLIPLYYSEVTIPVSARLAGVAVNLHHDIMLFDARLEPPG